MSRGGRGRGRGRGPGGADATTEGRGGGRGNNNRRAPLRSNQRNQQANDASSTSSVSSDGGSTVATITHTQTNRSLSVSFFANAGKNTRGKKQGAKTKVGYMGKVNQMVHYLFNRANGMFELREGEENNVDEYLEYFDPTKRYNKDNDAISWTTVTTIDEHQVQMEHKVRMVLPMKLQYFEEIFGYLCVSPELAGQKRKGRKKKKIIVLPTAGEGQIVNGEFEAPALSAVADPEDIATMSTSNMGGYKSALAWYIKVIRGLDVKSWEQYQPGEFNTNQSLDSILDQVVNGYKKTVADKKRRGVMSATEGKSCITNTGFTEIVRGCRRIAEGNNPSLAKYNASVFAAAWVLLQWNLVSRSISVEDLQLEHLDWEGDSMSFHFAKSKSDQTGEGHSNLKHVYANPVYPEICAITALAIFFFSTPRTCVTQRGGTRKLKDTKLFPGTSQKSRWRDVLADNIL